MLFRSDNVTAVCPEVIAAILAVNEGDAAPYGADAVTARLDDAFGRYFETPVHVHPVATGIAANALSLAAAMPPPGAAICHAGAHVNTSESGAPEFFSGGGKLITLDGAHGRLEPAAIERLLAALPPDRLQSAPPTVVTITQGTEAGTVYPLDRIAAIAAICRARGLVLHMDGARFENARARLGCTPAALSWRAGVDILSYGATKNGAMCADAVVIFRDSPHAERLNRFMGQRRLRAGQVFSKMRYLSAQLLAMVEDGVAARNAAHANAMAARLSAGLAALPGVRLVHPTEINEVFVLMPEDVRARLAARGFPVRARPEDPDLVRFVTAWNTRAQDVEAFLAAAGGAAVAAA
ncbi:beta-eliminating lyase-related protein [Elioraea sp.]|uniref:threonine aldolase family protein n=1 Tax=Elioraea sp. TaxID=2185103 RepID=UPI00307F632E